MSQDAEKYERLVALAGWLWTRIGTGQSAFRRSDLAEVEGLTYLSDEGDASRKAFERATGDLKSFGIEIEWDDSLINDRDPNAAGAYLVKGLKLTSEQQQALVGLAFTIAYRDLATDVALRIPGSFLDGAGDTLLLEANRFVAPMAEAIDEHLCVSFLYRDGDEPRAVQPMRLAYQRGTWYFSAYEFATDKTKVFRLDRVQSFDISDRQWSAVHDSEDGREALLSVDNRFFWGDGPLKQAALAIDMEAELSARRLLPNLEHVGKDLTGRLLMTQQYSNDENMLDAVLTLGPRIEILEPPELRLAIVQHVTAMIGNDT